jgi:succinate dehydrogenase/fumarate reductase cytochrome b subunit
MVDKSEKFSWLVRLGYFARGTVYLLLGYIALSTAGKAEDGQAAVFDLLQDIPLGTVILYFTAIGLLAYAGFKAIDAASDLENHGADTKGRLKRVGSAASAVAHLLLAWTAYKFATGEMQQSSQGDGGSQETASSLLTWEIGAFVLGVVGIGFIVGAAMQAKDAWTASFMKRIGGGAPSYVRPVGRAGHAARAVVFLLIGWSLIRGAWFSQSSEVKGLGDAIVALSGSGIYSLVAIGLIMFGVFSMITARYRVIPDVHHRDLKPHF